LPGEGKVFISVADRAKDGVVDLAKRLEKMGFELLATRGTAKRLEAGGVRVERLKKIQEGHPNVLDYVRDGQLQLVMNTPSGKGARTAEGQIRAAAVAQGVACLTSIQAADAAVRAMEAMRREEMTVQPVQDRLPAYRKVTDGRGP
jgi:carbamoyl-phosphate synthase large subunit